MNGNKTVTISSLSVLMVQNKFQTPCGNEFQDACFLYRCNHCSLYGSTCEKSVA
uniref:Uncharacterized protein n=1 Tax=Arundo donax TaxID=35708 RepID=A0A0A8YJU4_ARUDO